MEVGRSLFGPTIGLSPPEVARQLSRVDGLDFDVCHTGSRSRRSSHPVPGGTMHPTELTASPRVDEGATARTLAKCGTQGAKSVLGPSTFAVGCLPMSVADPLTAAFRSAQDGEGLPREFAHFRVAGRGDFEILDGAAARRGEPALADEMCRAIRFQGERYIDPARYVRAIAGSTCGRGGRIVEGTKVRDIHATRSGVTVAGEEYDSVVLAHGAWTNRLARRAGVRKIVRSGRGYTFTVKMDRLPEGPGCFPRADGRLYSPGRPGADRRDHGLPRRQHAQGPATHPVPRRPGPHAVAGARLDGRQDEWIGARPCTADGLPLTGAGNDPHV
ncbi:NAD(P)/FAD-dependent oxidoreductase [Streptomyces sp. NPDC018026]|uniref:NAD(P)/FAD-dependent oxidoreductase n=1 Tax=Streptomyces sp. NPDC018026 TaxID=3365031 RepID=UPI00378E11B4